MRAAPGDAPAEPVPERLRPLGAPTDPVRPTGRVRGAPGPIPRRGKRSDAMLYLLVLLVVLVLAGAGLFLLFGAAAPFP